MPPLSSETPQPGDPAPSTPADDTLLAFLRRRHAGEPLPAAAGAHFHDADIYAADPATLTAGYQPSPARKGEGGSWFFFTHLRPKSSSDSRKSRMVGGGAGTWHSERAPRAVLDGEGNCVGHSQYFSFKRKTGKNCSERTDWYMVELSEGQVGDHERVHGGEPVLVLCNIYKAHSSSRSSSSSRSTRKRKSTDEDIDQCSVPVKAKRRLFDSTAPSPATTSQEQVSSSFSVITSPFNSEGEAEKSKPVGQIRSILDNLLLLGPEGSHGITEIDIVLAYLKSLQEPKTSQNKTGKNCSERTDWYAHSLSVNGSASRPAPSASARERKATTDDRVDLASVPIKAKPKLFNSSAPVSMVTSQEELSATDNISASAAPDSVLGSKPEMPQPKLSSEGWINWRDESNATSDTESRRFWMDEIEASQVDTSNFLMADDAPPVPTHASACCLSDSGFRTQQDSCKSFWIPVTEETEKSHVDATSKFLMAGDAPPVPTHALLSASSWILDSAFKHQQDPYDSFWMPDTEGSHVNTSSFQMVSDAPALPAHCAPGNLSLPSACLIGHGLTPSSSNELGWLSEVPTYGVEFGSGGAGFTGPSNMCSMPSCPVPPPMSPSWWCSFTDIWTC